MKCIEHSNPCLKQTNYGNGQIVLTDWTAVGVTVGNGGVMCMIERGEYENPTYLSWIRHLFLLIRGWFL